MENFPPNTTTSAEPVPTRVSFPPDAVNKILAMIGLESFICLVGGGVFPYPVPGTSTLSLLSNYVNKTLNSYDEFLLEWESYDPRVMIVKCAASDNIIGFERAVLEGATNVAEALVEACSYASLSMIDYIYTYNPQRIPKLDQPMFQASKRGDKNIIDYLLERGAVAEWGILGAAEGGYIHLIDYLVEKGADIHTPDLFINWWINSRDYALVLASAAGHVDAAKHLLDNKLDPDANKGLPLIKASAAGHFDVVKLILESGTGDDEEGWRALVEASAGGYLDVVKILVRSRPATYTNSRGVEYTLSGYGSGSTLTDLLSTKHTRLKVEKALLAAAKNGKLNVVQYFVEGGANHNTHNVLTAAVKAGRFNVILYLIDKYRYNVNYLLEDAAGAGQVDVVRYLIGIGADPSTDKGKSIIAASSKYESVEEEWYKEDELNHIKRKKDNAENLTEIVKILIENKADVHANNDAPLYRASSQGNFNLVKLLLENGADPTSANNRSIAIASRRRYSEVVDLLLEYGADRKMIKEPSLYAFYRKAQSRYKKYDEPLIFSSSSEDDSFLSSTSESSDSLYD